MIRPLPLAIVGLLAAFALSASLAEARTAALTVAQMRGARRVLVVAAPGEHDVRLERQRRALARWRGAAERDVSMVEVVGGQVHGAADTAAALRNRIGVPAGSFAVVLIGKDGHVALRSATALPSSRLEAVIDGMPMRRAGQR